MTSFDTSPQLNVWRALLALAVVFVMLLQVHYVKWVWVAEKTFLRATFAFTIVSALHYVYLVGRRLHAMSANTPALPNT